MIPLLAFLAAQAPATAADFFPLVPGSRRTYEQKGDVTATLIDEVGTPEAFDGTSATPVVQKSQFNQVIGKTYYRVVGPTVLIVGYAEDRTASTPVLGGAVDLTRRAAKRNVLLRLTPAMPVFRYEGKETSWSFGEVPVLQAVGVEGEEAIRTDETAIKGSAKEIAPRTVLGRKVEAIEIKAEVQLGSGKLAQRIVETSVYGRGIGLLESVRKTSGGGTGRAEETRTRLVGIEDPPSPLPPGGEGKG